MKLLSLEVFQFRKLKEGRYSFQEGFNGIVGRNARGKTSILEALHLLMHGSSFRTTKLDELATQGETQFYIKVAFEKAGIRQSLSFEYNKGKKEILYNATSSSSLSSLNGVLLGSQVLPDDAALIKGSPHHRRAFLDQAISSTDPLYSWHLNRYMRACKQRNVLLKNKELTTIDSWEHEMGKSAAFLSRNRKKAVLELNPFFKKYFKEIGGEDEEVDLVYSTDSLGETSTELEEYYLKTFKSLRSKEVHYGFTLKGPHKDDLSFSLNEMSAKTFASEGQKQSVLAALKFAEWERTRLFAEEDPLFMVDDFGLGMDRERKERFKQLLHKIPQVIITTTDDTIPSKILL